MLDDDRQLSAVIGHTTTPLEERPNLANRMAALADL